MPARQRFPACDRSVSWLAHSDDGRWQASVDGHQIRRQTGSLPKIVLRRSWRRWPLQNVDVDGWQWTVAVSTKRRSAKLRRWRRRWQETQLSPGDRDKPSYSCSPRLQTTKQTGAHQSVFTMQNGNTIFDRRILLAVKPRVSLGIQTPTSLPDHWNTCYDTTGTAKIVLGWLKIHQDADFYVKCPIFCGGSALISHSQ